MYVVTNDRDSVGGSTPGTSTWVHIKRGELTKQVRYDAPSCLIMSPNINFFFSILLLFLVAHRRELSFGDRWVWLLCKSRQIRAKMSPCPRRQAWCASWEVARFFAWQGSSSCKVLGCFLSPGWLVLGRGRTQSLQEVYFRVGELSRNTWTSPRPDIICTSIPPAAQS